MIPARGGHWRSGNIHFGEISCFTPGRGTPFAGRYYLPVKDSLFYTNLTPNDPVSQSPHPMTLFFQILIVKFQIFHALRMLLECFVNFQLIIANFHSNFIDKICT